MSPTIRVYLCLLSRAERAVVEQLKEEYPIGAKIKAKIQSNRGADNCLVVCVIGERPGFLRVKYETTGYETTVHCKNVVG